MGKNIVKAHAEGDPNIGLYGVATDFFFFHSSSFNVDPIKVLEVEHTLSFTIDEMPFIGMFVVANTHGIILPYMIKNKELNLLKNFLRETGNNDMNIHILKWKENALGNLMLCNDYGCVISSSLDQFKKTIQDVLGVEEVEQGTIMGAGVVGSLGYATNSGFIISAYAEEEEYQHIKEILKVEGDIGTVNYGSPFVASGIIANTKGAMVGENSTSIEIGRIAESLNLL